MTKPPIAPFLAILCSIASSTTFGQIKFAPEIGAQATLQVRKTNAVQNQNSGLFAPAAFAGVNLDVRVLKNLYLQPGIFYDFKNIKYDSELVVAGLTGTLEATSKYRLHYLRVPVMVLYKSGMEGMGRFLAGAGMYGAYAVGGNLVTKYPTATTDGSGNIITKNVRANSSITFGDDASRNTFRPLDLGLQALIGYESNVGLYFKGNLYYGLSNIDVAGSADYKVKNWGFGISIGCTLGSDEW
ncbi:MAG: outer membrane beta-barrel protein [Edaphocola sp.]